MDTETAARAAEGDDTMTNTYQLSVDGIIQGEMDAETADEAIAQYLDSARVPADERDAAAEEITVWQMRPAREVFGLVVEEITTGEPRIATVRDEYDRWAVLADHLDDLIPARRVARVSDCGGRQEETARICRELEKWRSTASV
jgi:hypothetical protein